MNALVVGVSADTPETQQRFIEKFGLTFPVIADWVLIRKLVPGGGHRVVNPEGRLSEPFRSWSFTRTFWEVRRAAADQ